MSKITYDGLTKPGLAQDALQLYPYGNSGRRRIKPLMTVLNMLLKELNWQACWQHWAKHW